MSVEENNKIEDEIALRKEKVKLHEATFIDFNKENYKKVIDVYYSSLANFDKILITILFAEIGYLIHTIPDGGFQLSYLLPMLSGACGIGVSIMRYDVDCHSLSSEKDKVNAESFDIIGVVDYNEDINELDKIIKELAIKSAKLKFWIIAFLISTSLTCVEAIYFIRQSGNSNKCILLSFLLVIAFARAEYCKRKKKNEWIKSNKTGV